LSTGLRINSGKDDPAGLIASEVLRADMTSTSKAITNSQRANQMIATADSALGQVSSLLNDIRGLVSEAANTGAMSAEQIAANQLQIDSSLEAIDRISQVTQFQGKRLLDGSLDFITQGTDSSKISNIKIDQATFGNSSQIGATVEMVAQATEASLNYAYTAVSEAVVLEIGGSDGYQTFQFAAGSSVDAMASAINLVSDALGVRAEVAAGATAGSLTVSSLGANNDMVLTAKQAGFNAGNMNVKYTVGNSSATTATYQAGSDSGDPGTINVALRTVAGVSATGTTDDTSLMTKASALLDGAAANSDLTFTAVKAGAAGNNLKVTFVSGAANKVSFNEADGTMTVELTAGTKANQVMALVNNDATASQHMTVSLATGSDGTGNVDIPEAAVSLSGGKGDVNNELVITAAQNGTEFNGTNVNVVSGNATAAGIQSINRKATLTVDSAGGDLLFTAKESGEAGNEIEIVFTADSAAPSLSVVGKKITIKTDLSAHTTSSAVKALIDADVNASKLVDVTLTNASGAIDTYINSGQKLNNGHHATRSLDTAGGAALNFEAKASGRDGEAISIVVTKTTAATAFTVDGNTITLNLDSDGASTTRTGSAVLAAFNSSAAAQRLISLSAVGDAAVTVEGVATGTYALTTTDATHTNGFQGETVEYSKDAKAAQASVTWGSGSENDIIITATQAGSAFNDVSIKFRKQAGLGAANAYAEYSNKTLTINVDDTTDTNISVIKAAISAVADSTGRLLFTVADDDSAGDGAGTGVVDVSAMGDNVEVGNTANTGGDAGTLFVYVEEGQTIANNVIDRLAAAKAAGTGLNDADDMTARAAELFNFSRAGGNDGSGKVFAKSYSGLLSGGVNGGAVAATAEEVTNAINANSELSALLTASLAAGNDGKNVAVAAFEEAGYFGDIASNNRLQFLGGLDSSAIQLVAGAAGSSLSIQDNRSQASMTKDSTNANAGLVFTAKQKGSEYDGVRVVFVDDNKVTKGNEIVTYDKDSKTLRFAIANGNTAGANTTASDIVAALNADDVASTMFVASNFGTSTGAGEVNADLKQASNYTAFNGGKDVLLVTSNAYGSAGNSYTITLQDGASPSVSFSGGALTITADLANTRVDQLAQQINTAMGGTFTAEVLKMDDGGTLGGEAFSSTFGNGIGTDSNGNGVPDPVSTDTVTSGGRGDKMIINLATDSQGVITTTANDLIAFLGDSANATLVNNFGISASNVGTSTGAGRLSATTTDIDMTTKGTTSTPSYATGTSTAVNGINARVKVTANQIGSNLGDVQVVFENDDLVTAGNETAAYSNGVLTVKMDEGTSTAAQVIAAINRDAGTLFTAANGDGGNGTGTVAASDKLTLSSGMTTTGTAQGVSLVGNEDAASTGLTIKAANYGSSSFVSVKALSGTFVTKDADGNTADRDVGSDVNVRVNGIQALGKGLTATLKTAALDMTFTMSSTMAAGTSTSFAVTGGGAQFQLGPDVVSNQQARIGIASMSVSKLGGDAGRLYELRSGGAKSLANDSSGAARVAEEVITQITNVRGRLGAFQKTTLDTNIAALNDTLESLTAAESDIRDADFAAESAAMTRAQILVQAGTTVLSTANQNPQNVLSLLR
jgi:flagellin-like hook-associated protein FlgL